MRRVHPCPNWVDGKVDTEIELQVLTGLVSFQRFLWHIPVPEFEESLSLATFESDNKITLQANRSCSSSLPQLTNQI